MTDKQPEALKWADAVQSAHMPQLAEFLRTQHADLLRKDALLKQALEAMAHGCPPDCKDGSTDSGGTYPWGEAVLMRCPTCETFDSITKELQ